MEGGGYRVVFPLGASHRVDWREEDVILAIALELPPLRSRTSQRQRPTASSSSSVYAAEFFMSEDVRKSILDALGDDDDL